METIMAIVTASNCWGVDRWGRGYWTRMESSIVNPVVHIASKEEQLAWRKQQREEQWRLYWCLFRYGGLLSYLWNWFCLKRQGLM